MKQFIQGSPTAVAVAGAETDSVRQSMVQGAIGAVGAVLLTLGVTSLWAAKGWPGALFVTPATFFAVMGVTFAFSNAKWRERPPSFKLLVVALYGLFGAVVVGGLTALTQQ